MLGLGWKGKEKGKKNPKNKRKKKPSLQDLRSRERRKAENPHQGGRRKRAEYQLSKLLPAMLADFETKAARQRVRKKPGGLFLALPRRTIVSLPCFML